MEKKRNGIRTIYIILTLALAVAAFNLYPATQKADNKAPMSYAANAPAPSAAPQTPEPPAAPPPVVISAAEEEPAQPEAESIQPEEEVIQLEEEPIPHEEEPIAEAEEEQPIVEPEPTEQPTEITVPFTGWINGEAVNVRARPSREAAIVVVLDIGNVVKVKGVEGDWLQITIGEVQGYVHYEFVTPAERD